MKPLNPRYPIEIKTDEEKKNYHYATRYLSLLVAELLRRDFMEAVNKGELSSTPPIINICMDSSPSGNEEIILDVEGRLLRIQCDVVYSEYSQLISKNAESTINELVKEYMTGFDPNQLLEAQDD